MMRTSPIARATSRISVTVGCESGSATCGLFVYLFGYEANAVIASMRPPASRVDVGNDLRVPDTLMSSSESSPQ
jgi:hypothetical protein